MDLFIFLHSILISSGVSASARSPVVRNRCRHKALITLTIHFTFAFLEARRLNSNKQTLMGCKSNSMCKANTYFQNYLSVLFMPETHILLPAFSYVCVRV